MKPIEFKEKWIQDKSDRWVNFDSNELGKSDINESTKEFISNGFPEDAAPYLGFGWRSYDWKFYNIFDYYEYDDLDPITKSYWILGSDNSGNPICIDSSTDDRILLLDHEQDFEVIEVMNKNVEGLANSLLLYRDFIESVNSEFTENQIIELEEKFKLLNSNYYIECSFWDTEIENLRAEMV